MIEQICQIFLHYNKQTPETPPTNNPLPFVWRTEIMKRLTAVYIYTAVYMYVYVTRPHNHHYI